MTPLVTYKLARLAHVCEITDEYWGELGEVGRVMVARARLVLVSDLLGLGAWEQDEALERTEEGRA